MRAIKASYYTSAYIADDEIKILLDEDDPTWDLKITVEEVDTLPHPDVQYRNGKLEIWIKAPEWASPGMVVHANLNFDFTAEVRTSGGYWATESWSERVWVGDVESERIYCGGATLSITPGIMPVRIEAEPGEYDPWGKIGTAEATVAVNTVIRTRKEAAA